MLCSGFAAVDRLGVHPNQIRPEQRAPPNGGPTPAASAVRGGTTLHAISECKERHLLC